MHAFKRMRALLMCSAAVTTALSTTPALAQEVIELETIQIDSKREVATNTATAETIVDQEEIEDRQAGSIAELVDSVPGVNLVNGGSPIGSGINIRGIGANGTYGSDQKVGIQIGGASKGSEELYRIGTQLYTDPSLYKEVTVLRGTGGTYEFGSGFIGGLLLLEPIHASDLTLGEPGFKLRETLQFSTNGDGIASSTTLAWQASDNFEVLGNFTWREEGVTVDGAGEDRSENGYGLPSWLVNARLTFGNSDEHALSLLLSETSTDERDVPYDTFGTTGDMFGNVDRQTEDKTMVLRYEYDSPTTDLINLQADLSYSDQKIDQEYVPGSSICESIDCGFPFPPGGFPSVNADHRYETTKLTVKNVAHFETGAVSHELRAGLEWSHRRRLDAASAPGGTDERYALFVIDNMDFPGGLTLSPQLRYETQRIGGAAYDYYENDAIMGGVSARYAFGNGVAVFGGAYYNEALPIMDDLGNPDYMTQSEKANTYEVGVSYDGVDVFTAGDALAVKALVYRTELWDITSFLGSVEEARLEGIEIEAAYSMENGFYVDASINVPRGYNETDGAANDYYSRVPGDELRLTLGKRWGEELDLSYELVAVARMDRDEEPTPGYAVHNLRATYRPQQGALEGMELRLGIENLGDRDYTPHLATRPATGRNVKFTLAKTF